jgi:NAD-dependent dihydropyrimidine dehydrogenase PreA subunit
MSSTDADADPGAASAGCKHPAGRFAPVIDANRCEGKAACVAECPYDVFVVRRRERVELPQLGLLGTLKWWVHGGLQADAVRADQCHGCGLCVSACPESAITLRRVDAPHPSTAADAGS